MAVVAAATCAAAAPGAQALGKPGDLNPTFNGGSSVNLSLARANPASTYVQAVTADASGQLLVAGGATDANGKQAALVARLTSGGALDPSFGTGGSAVLQLGEGSGANRPFSSADSVFTTPTGRIGTGIYRIRTADRGDQSALELLDNGQPDLDFGSGGLATRDPATAPAYANTAAAAVAPDGSVFVSGILEGTPSSGANRKLALTKFTSAGQLATFYGTNAGTYIGSFSLYPSDTGTYGGPMIATADGKVLMAGTTLWTDSRQAMLLARFTAGGQPDTTFGTRPGNTVVHASDPGASSGDSQGSALALGPLGAIYVAGPADDAQGRFAMTIARFSPSGEPDFTFGTNGVKRFQVATGSDVNRRSYASAIVVQPDGKPILVGTSYNTNGESEGIILRLKTDGTLDPTFGSGGVVRLQLAPAGNPSRNTSLNGAVIVGGQLVVSGGTYATESTGLVARVLLNPLPDPPPGGGGGGQTPPHGNPPPLPLPAGNGTVRFNTKSLTVDATGRIRIVLKCPATALSCTGKLQLVASNGTVATAAAKRKRAKTYALASYRIAAGKASTLTVKLNATARSRLRGHRSLPARLVLTPTGGKAKTYKVTLKRKAAKRR